MACEKKRSQNQDVSVAGSENKGVNFSILHPKRHGQHCDAEIEDRDSTDKEMKMGNPWEDKDLCVEIVGPLWRKSRADGFWAMNPL